MGWLATMNWKEFFKPTKGKIITTIILTLFFLMMFYGGTNPFLNFFIKWTSLIIFIPAIQLSELVSGMIDFIVAIFIIGGIPEAVELAIFYFVWVIYSYILSCIILFMYSKYKKPDQLTEWIKSEEAQRYTEQQLKDYLGKKGYEPKKIDKAIKLSKENTKKIMIISIIIFLVIGVSIPMILQLKEYYEEKKREEQNIIYRDAIDNLNLDRCRDLDQLSDQVGCLTGIASIKNDVSLCLRIRELIDERVEEYSAATCILYVAERNKDPSMCELIIEHNLKQEFRDKILQSSEQLREKCIGGAS